MTDTPTFTEVLSRAIPADGTTIDQMRAALWDTPAGRTMINKGDVVLYWLNEADVTRAALAAAPQPMGCGLPCGYDCNGACFDAAAPQPAPVERQALVQMIVQAMLGRVVGLHMAETIADALLARGLRLPGETRNRVEYDDAGLLDEVVTDAGMHLERMSGQGWYLSGQRSDGSEIAVWIKGKVTLVEERPAIRVVEGGDDE